MAHVSMDWLEERRERRKKTRAQRLKRKKYRRRVGEMNKKELKRFFGSSFGKIQNFKQEVESDGIILYADKNCQLYEVEIKDEKEWSEEEADEFLNTYRGWPIKLLIH